MKLIMENWRDYQKGLFEERGAPIQRRRTIHKLGPIKDLFNINTGEIDPIKAAELEDAIDQVKSNMPPDPERDAWLLQKTSDIQDAIAGAREQWKKSSNNDPEQLEKLKAIEKKAAEVRALIKSRQTDVDTIDTFRDTLDTAKRPRDAQTVATPPPIPSRRSNVSEATVQLIEDLIILELIEEGFLQDLGAKSSNALKALALASAILAPMAPVGSAEAAPRAKVERMIIKGKMTDAQKKRLAKSEAFLNMELDALNDHLKSERFTNMDRSNRLLTLRILGATQEDFPFGQEVTKEELVKFLLTGESPGKKEVPEEEPQDPEYMQNVDAFLDDAEDAGRQIGGAVKKSANWIKNLFEKGRK